MSTPYEKILDVFHSKLKSKVEIDYDLEFQYFFNALGSFELDLYPLDYDETLEELSNDLKRPEILLLGTLMYREYLSQERDRILKLNNIIGRDIKLTGSGDSKSNINKAMVELENQIAVIIDKLKTNNFDT
jgi:hypothetical protein